MADGYASKKKGGHVSFAYVCMDIFLEITKGEERRVRLRKVG